MDKNFESYEKDFELLYYKYTKLFFDKLNAVLITSLVVLSVIIAIAGFFGYREVQSFFSERKEQLSNQFTNSLNELQDKSQNATARIIADAELNVKQSLDQLVRKEAENYFETEFNKLYNDFRITLENIVQEFRTEVNNHTQNIPDSMTSAIDSEVNKYFKDNEQDLIDAAHKLLRDSLPSILKEVKNEVVKDAVGALVSEDKEIRKNIREGIMDQVKSEVLVAVRSEIQEKLKGLDLQPLERAAKDLVSTLEESFQKDRYMVIGASSQHKQLIDAEFKRLKHRYKIDTHFQTVKVAKIGKYWSIQIDSNLSLENAKKVKEEALKKGFRRDTYIRPM